MKILNSIKGRLFLWFFAFMSLLLVSVGFALYQKAREAIFVSIDHELDAQIQIVAGLLHIERGEIEFELSEVVSGRYSVPASGSYYKVVINDRVFAVSPSLVNRDFDFAREGEEIPQERPGDAAFTSTGPVGERLRVMRHEYKLGNRPVKIFLAESMEESLEAIGKIKLFLFIVIPASILTGAFVVLSIANRSLAPLQEFSGTVSQITHERLAEKIDTRNQAHELAVLAESFNRMLDRLRNAFENERRIVSDASHELKTPLSVIKTQCEVILQKKRNSEEYIEALDTINSSARRMGRLVNNLLSLARLDSGLLGTGNFAEVILNDCLEEAVQSLNVLAEKKRVQLHMAVYKDIRFYGDRERMIEALRNIIENGIRYNRDGGSVEITASERGDRAEVKISDTGAGIEKKDIEKIFDRFYRADASRSSEGAGLGLSIAKAVIDAHGGNIRIMSTPGEGSSFYISLPLAGRTETGIDIRQTM